jgi:aspartate aminotransferase-like enzyme
MTGIVYFQSVIPNGYGDLKGKTLRIAYRGDVIDAKMQDVLAAMSGFLED